MKKSLIIVALAAAAAGCRATLPVRQPRMTNAEYMDACDACKARGYVCADIVDWASGIRVGLQCDQDKDAGKANLQAMLQIATEPLDRRTPRGKKIVDKRAP